MKFQKIGMLAAGAGLALGMAGATAAVAGATLKPVATVTPHLKLVNDQVVVVKGHNFPASQTVAITECGHTAKTDAKACNQNTADLGKPGGPELDGSTSSTGVVPTANYTFAKGTIGDSSCKSGQTCYIAVATLSSLSPPTVSATVLVPVTVK